jgi:membrane-associated phospholipid phosphatase
MSLRKHLSLLAPVDAVSIAFLLFLIGLNLVFLGRVHAWLEIIAVDSAMIVLIFTVAALAASRKTKLFIGLHRWYCYPFIIFVFKEIHLMVRPIHPTDYDALFIAIDRWMFGVNPAQWMAQFAHPWLTEILQISYFSYYVLFLIFGIELYRRYPIAEFDHGAFLVVYGFYLSYLGYFLLPAIGPRFTLYDFYAINRELPGLFFTAPIRDFINAGESISFAIPNAAELVQRDVFPSGHTQLTLIVVYLSYRYRLKARWITTLLATLLIIGTVYLRYHYVVDLIGGALFFAFTIWSGKRIQRLLESRLKPKMGAKQKSMPEPIAIRAARKKPIAKS